LRFCKDYALSDNGTLVYVPDEGPGNSMSTLVWVDRGGHVVGQAVNGVLDSPHDPVLSRDGRRMLVASGGFGNGTLWIYDLDGKPPLPLTAGGDSGQGVWSPDGTQVAFGSTGIGIGGYDVVVLPADGSVRAPKRVHAGGIPGSVEAWTAAGELVVLNPIGSTIVTVPVTDGPLRELLPSGDLKGRCALSPDGRWLAFETNRSGAVDIWVARYPDGAAVRVSQNGGLEPVWSRDGRELFYRQRRAVMAVAVDTSNGFSFGPAQQLFDGPFATVAGYDPDVKTFDVAPDGRFLMVEPVGAEAKRPPTSIVVVQNWTDELRRRVPGR
jgi:serine/threonine-protein kinase